MSTDSRDDVSVFVSSPVFCLNRSSVDYVSCVSFSDGRIKRVGVSSKKRSVVWTDEEVSNFRMLAGQSFGFGVLPSTEESQGVDTEMSGSVKWSKLYVSLCVCVY
ncbi:hypothetical protein DY000_02005320 [Brassica cretica]|uniref:Uncharacterized protein n=1 Tax=Brassica cretica TaxID=69181 RepID=A0ABQ7C7I7_BRACR|nr:hypothetical protein DY000_02005320 [Brassica cretica]